MERLLIINADDFGQSHGVNRGILRAHREGVLTSASLMVRWPAAAQAARDAGDLDLGLHIDLGEWFCRNGDWTVRYQRVPLDDAQAVEAEIHSQLEEFLRFVGRPPTHLDSHQHVHLDEPVHTIARQLADELSVPLRACTAGVHYCGAFYGQSDDGTPYPEGVSVKAIVKLLDGLPEGVTELACHPGEDPDLSSTYALERYHEVEVLCDARVREALDRRGIRLTTFADLAPARRQAPNPP